MKKILIYTAIIGAIAAVLYGQYARIKSLTAERDKYRSNTETLLQNVEQYKTKDSLNAATVGALRLTLSEYQKYRADDAALIKRLQTKNRDLQAVTTAPIGNDKRITGNRPGIASFICPATRLRPYYVASILWNRGLSYTDAHTRTIHLPGYI